MGGGHEVPAANTQYRGQSHEVLKNWTDEGEPGDADGLGQTWREMGQGLTEAAENLMVAVFGSQAGWTGQAADSMRKHLQKVAEWSQKTGDSYKIASEAFVTQGESVGSAKTSMPDPVDYNPGQMIKDAAKSGSIIDIAMLPYNMYQTQQAQQQAHEKAIQVVAQRDAELASAAASIPPFEPPPKIEDPGGKEPGPNGPGMPGAPGGRPGMPGGGSRGGINGGGGGGAGGAGGGGMGGGGGMPGFPGGGMGGGGGGAYDPNNPNSNGEDNQGTPPNVGMPSLPVGSGTGTSGFAHTPTNFGGGGPGGFPPGGIPGGAGPAGGGGGFGGAFGGGFGPGGAPRPGGGFGPMGPGSAAGGGAGGAGAGAGAGAGSGMGGAGAGGRGAGMAGGGRGGGGMGAGGMGGGRGEGGEDDEHQRPSYLVEPDPDATFGSDQMTAPPVIGG